MFSNILCFLYGVSQRLVSTSNDTHHPFFGNAEGGRQFTGIEDSQAPTGTCTDIKQSATTLHTWFDSLYQRLYLRKGFVDSLSHQTVFVVDVL